MNIIDHLDLIDRLVSEKASPSEIRGHVLAIREQIEAYQKEAEGRNIPNLSQSRCKPSNKTLHRTANCAWEFALEFFLFISQLVAVGELWRSTASVDAGQE